MLERIIPALPEQWRWAQSKIKKLITTIRMKTTPPDCFNKISYKPRSNLKTRPKHVQSQRIIPSNSYFGKTSRNHTTNISALVNVSR